jgi:GNAT superfamily N-acetyltransferase
MATVIPPIDVLRRLAYDDGRDVVVRRAGAADAEAVALMHRRCSLDTVFRRYFTAMPQVSPTMQAQLLSTRLVLAAQHGSDVVGLAHLAESVGQPTELAVLVEDAWQRHGIGRALAESALDVAESWGIDRVVAYTLQSSSATHALLRKLRGGRLHPRFTYGEDSLVHVTMDLDAVSDHIPVARTG